MKYALSSSSTKARFLRKFVVFKIEMQIFNYWFQILLICKHLVYENLGKSNLNSVIKDLGLEIQNSEVCLFNAEISYKNKKNYFICSSSKINNMERINLLEVENVAKIKHEIYRILTVEGGMYLPPEKECSISFISEIWIGDKKIRLFLLLSLL